MILLIRTGRFSRGVYNAVLIVRELLSFRAPWRSNPELDVKSGRAQRLPHALPVAIAVAILIFDARYKY